MPVRLLHLSDCHVGASHAYLGDRAAARREEAHATFRDAIEFAIDANHAIDAVVIAGELFDSRRPNGESLALTRGLLARLVANGLTVVVLPGFHDALGYHYSVYRTERFPGVDVITSTEPGMPLGRDVRGQRVWFYGVAHVPGRTGERFTGFDRHGEEGFHVGILHGAVPDHPESRTRNAPWSIPIEALERSQLDYFALGHAHEFTQFHLEHGTAAYCGTLEGQSFAQGDLGRKSLVIVTLDESGTQVECRPFSKKVVADDRIDLDAEHIRDIDALRASLLARANPTHIARFTLQGTREFLFDRDAVLSGMESRFAYLTIEDQSSFDNSALIRRLGSENTIRGFFVRRMRQKLDALHARLAANPQDTATRRALAVVERSLVLGLEQFLEEDTPAAPLPRPASVATVRQSPSVQIGANGNLPLRQVTGGGSVTIEPAREQETSS